MSFNPFSNLPIKIGAVVLAFLLWVHVATNQTYEHIFEIPFHVANVPSGLILTSDIPDQLSVQVRATGKELLGLLTDDMSYRFDLADFSAGNHSVEIAPAEVTEFLSGGHEDVKLLSPRRIQFTLEREITREMPVVANLKVVAADGFIEMDDPEVRPERITVAGPESVMKKLRQISTEKQSIVGKAESFEIALPLHLPDTLHLSTRDSVVSVSVSIEPRDERRFENISVIPPRRFNQNRYQFTPGSLNLALGIPRSLVDSINADDISVSFEIPSSTDDSTRVPLLYRLPNRVNIIETSADSVLIIRKS